MVSMCKDVLSVSVKRFVNKRKEDLNAFSTTSTTSIRICNFEISCCDYRTPGIKNLAVDQIIYTLVTFPVNYSLF